MKKLKMLLLLAFISSRLLAQTTDQQVSQPMTPPPPPPPPPSNGSWQSFRLGLEVEPLLSWGKAKDNTISSSGVKPGFGFGIMGDFYFSRNYALNTGLTLVYIDAPITYDSVETVKIPKTTVLPRNTTIDYKLQYVEIPVDFKLKTDQVGYLSYFGQFGGVLGINIGANGNFSNSAFPSSNMNDVKLSSNVNLLNVGLLIGIGVEYNVVGHTNLMAGISYVNNFTNFTGNPNAAINHINLNLGVFF